MRRWAWLALLLAGAWDPVTKPDGDVADGNKHFAAGKFGEAEGRYRAAEKRLAREPALHFDLGAALYKLAEALPAGPPRDAQLDAAEKELRQALDAADPRLRSSAHYNLGNTLFQRNKMGDAIEEYKRSLKLDPAREDARHNLELALRMKQEQQKKQQGQNQDQKQQQGQQQQPPQQGEQQQQGQQEQQQQQQQQQQQEEQQQQQQQQAGQQGQDQQQQQSEPQPQQADKQQGEDKKQDQPPQDLSAEDEERKLDALERDSNQMRAKRAHDEAREQRRGRQVKDW
jgi:tetratricopeptide repeat protein